MADMEDDTFAEGDEALIEEERQNLKKKGRGHTDNAQKERSERYGGEGAQFEVSRGGDGEKQPAKSVEGWIIFVNNVHEEAQEDDIHDKFAEYGEIKNLHLPLDRRTGFVKGYALVEYDTQKEAQEAISATNGESFMEQEISVDWAFVSAKA
eukprot:CAMPEP_0168597166 /NCGR_PEP_ID=MMETSP0420-20121227/10480_1 /TAXON_ID=498008 /ORGANISM="Pessonella sp." /LENGTH=151 /DNA_ID=CAMNT_0008633921 /DNA_START=27 /DNA_END=479 /DNA_ORIENTATION=-